MCSKKVYFKNELFSKNNFDSTLENQNHLNYLQMQNKFTETLSFAKASFSTTQAKYLAGKIDSISWSSVKNQLLSSEYDVLKNSLHLEYINLKIKLIK